MAIGRRSRTTTPTLNGNKKFVHNTLRIVEGAAFNSYANQYVATCLGDTRYELLGTINRWANGSIAREHVYWLQGKAGTGKSTIARIVAGKLTKQGCLAASFFFKRNESDRGGACYVFSTIVAQLAQKLPVVAEHMRNAIETNLDIAVMALGEQFRKLILQLMQSISYDAPKTMMAVIDALDECEGDEDITTIIKLLLQTDRLVVVPLKFFVTSWFEPPIRLGFWGPVIKRDIITFLRFRLDEIRSRFELASDWPDPTQFCRLVTSSVSLFIFAATICRFIEDNRLVGGPDDRIKRILEHKAGGTFDATYLPVLNQMVDGLKGSARSDTVTEFKEIVGSIVTVANLLGAASLALFHFVLDILSDPGNPLRVFYESFRDFLIHLDLEETHEFCVNEEATYKMLADRCLVLLSDSGYLKQDICVLGASESCRTSLD
ncbi:unnamed protein product [Penicillium salamii]|uniref:Nephrocystin 3-like N-terminal domain-containing protein n=1 Tax=Penicillium salamii TaxID=1612424 RepID=A0A9W4JRR1_9EURO|nr:unnamed protein product [Penicillium salamii]